jgi:mannose-6-phosphate isomerase-like protein (cupin superfamily)
MEDYLTIMQNYKPYFIDNDSFRQVSKPDSANYVIYEWKQLAKCYLYGFYFKHDFDVTYFAKTSAVKFVIDDQEMILQRGANILIPANSKYSFRGLEHCQNEMACMGDARARESWEAVERAMATAQNLTRVS